MNQSTELTASGQTIRSNIRRLWKTISNAETETGIARGSFHKAIREGVIHDPMAGKLYKLGVDPRELVKTVEQAQ